MPSPIRYSTGFHPPSKIVWTEVSDLSFWKNAAAALYGVKAIPQNFLLDPQGRIIGKNLRGDELALKLAAIL
jgi:hypothetical protein